MVLIIAMIIVVYLIAIIWTWKSLGEIEKSKKIAIIIGGIAIIYLITLIIFTFSKKTITYDEIIIEKNIKNMVVILFTGLNSLVLPFLSRTIEKAKVGDIGKEQFTKRIIITLLIFLILMFFECGYMKNMQQGILNIYQSKIKA